MAKFRKTQSSFISGIIGPELRGRIDIGEYNNGALEIENFIGTESGALMSRGGLNYIPLYYREAPSTKLEISDVLKYCDKQVHFFDIDDSEWIGFIGLSENARIVNTSDANYRYAPIGAINITTGEVVRPEAPTGTTGSEYIYSNDPNYYAWNVKADLGDTKFLSVRIGNVFKFTHTSGKYAPTIIRWLPSSSTLYAFPLTIFSDTSTGSVNHISQYATAQKLDLIQSSAAFAQPWRPENLNKDLKFKFTRIGTVVPYTYEVELVNDGNTPYTDFAGQPVDPLNRGRLFRFGFPNLAPASGQGYVFMYYAGYRDIATLSFPGSDVDDTTDTFNVTAHGLVDNDTVVFYTKEGIFPLGLKPNTVYYVINSATNTFQLSETSGGTAVDLVKGLQSEADTENIQLSKVDTSKTIFQEVYNYIDPGTFTSVDFTSSIPNEYHIPNSTFTTTWAYATWGGFDGYPKVATAIASRGVFANSDSFPTAIWFSLQDNIFYFNNYKSIFKYEGRPGVPKFYSVSDVNDNITARFPASDDSIPFEYVLTDELSREIRWLYPSRNLEFGTDVGEFTYKGFSVVSSEVEFQSSYGSVFQSPLKVGNATIFVLKDGKTLGRILFDFQRQANSVTNLNILAPNILNDFRKFYDNYDTPFIKNIQWDHVRKVLWIITTTGDVFSVTTSFNVDQFGWQSHSFAGKCKDILITKNKVGDYSQDMPLLIFDKTIEHMVPRNEYPLVVLNNNDQIYVANKNIFNYHYLDSAETINDFTKNTVVWTFTNPNFLNQSVHVFADNQYLSEKQLSSKAAAYITNVLFTAVNVGDTGNSISLVFNGTDSVGTVVAAWNTANPTNQVNVEYKALDNTQVPTAQTVNLKGAGYNLIFDDLVNNKTGNRFSTITAGFPFKNRLKKTLLFSGSNTESGLEAYKRIDRIELKFFRSVYAKVGSEDGNLRDVVFPLGNDILNLQDYNYVDAFSGNSESEHTVIIESDLPLPVNILTITTRGVLAE